MHCLLLVGRGRSPESRDARGILKYTFTWLRKERCRSSWGQRPEFDFKEEAVTPQAPTGLGDFSTAFPPPSFWAPAFFQPQKRTSGKRHPLQPPPHGSQPWGACPIPTPCSPRAKPTLAGRRAQGGAHQHAQEPSSQRVVLWWDFQHQGNNSVYKTKLGHGFYNHLC